MKNVERTVLATTMTDCWLAGSNVSRRKCSGGEVIQLLIFLFFLLLVTQLLISHESWLNKSIGPPAGLFFKQY